MKTYTIHLLRHALTRGNLEGRYIGQTDEPLCREGREQLLKMKNDYDYPKVDVVFSSSLMPSIMRSLRSFALKITPFLASKE